MFSIDQGCITSRESGAHAIIQLFTVECSIHCYILNKPIVINYSFEITPNDTQHDYILNETILFGDGLYRSRLGGRVALHLLSLGGVKTKYPLLIAASNNSTP